MRPVWLAVFGLTCTPAVAKTPGPALVVTLASAAALPGDTARYLLTIMPAPVTPSSPAVTSWNVRLLGADTTRDSTGDYAKALVYHNTGTRVVDTLAIVTPLTFVDSTGPYRVAVRGNNPFGGGPWVKSAAWWVKRRGLPPGPPGILVDSTALNKLGIARVDFRPQVVTFTEGAVFQLCPFVLGTDGQKYQLGDSTRGTGSNGVMVLTRFDTITVCKAEFAKYLAERPA